MKKLTCLGLSLALALGLFTGCGSSNQDQGSGSGSQSNTNDSSTVELSGTVNTAGSTSMKDVMAALGQAADDFKSDPNNYAGLSEDELYKKVGELMMDAIRGVETQNVDVDLECERDEDGNWTEADSVADEITNALMS